MQIMKCSECHEKFEYYIINRPRNTARCDECKRKSQLLKNRK